MKLLLEQWREYLGEASGELYHAAPTLLRDQILTDGIMIVANKRYAASKESVIYAWEYYKLALWYSLTEGRDHETDFDIWKIKNPPSHTTDDSIGLEYAVILSESIPPENIELVDTVMVGDERLGTSAADIDDVYNEIEDME